MYDSDLLAGMSLEVDPGMWPVPFDVRSGAGRLRALLPDAVRAKAEELWRRADTDPEFAADLAEEVASLSESALHITHPCAAGRPEKCEVCGTLVAVVPEVAVVAVGAPRDSEPSPGLWEPGQWRRHTPRRCGVMRRRASG